MARESLIERMTDGVMLLDAAGRIGEINPAALSSLHPADSPVGRLAWEVFPWLEPYKGKYEAQAEIRLEGPPPLWLDLRISPLYQGHVFNGSLLLLRDITADKRSQAELEERCLAGKRLVQRLETLHAVFLGLAAELDPARLLERVVKEAMSLLDAGVGELALFDEDNRILSVAVSYGRERLAAGKTIAIGEGLLGMVARTGQPLLIEDYRLWANRAPWDSGLRVALGAPLIAGSELLGVIAAGSENESRRFSQEDLVLLGCLAQQAAMAIRNSRLFAHKERQTTQDALTGLYNRHHFYALAEVEVERALRYHKDLTVILLDLDHFKRINEAYGHQAGDQVLKMVAQLCQPILRKVDIFARFGGEEMAILMPETNRDRALLAAARLRAMIEAEPIGTPRGKVALTVSLGVAELKDEANNLETLLDYAERALAMAKDAGRNQVQVYPKR